MAKDCFEDEHDEEDEDDEMEGWKDGRISYTATTVSSVRVFPCGL
jgi:hypothetical protein